MATLPDFFSVDRYHGFETEREMELAGVAAESSNDTWLWAGMWNYRTVILAFGGAFISLDAYYYKLSNMKIYGR